MRLLRFGVVGGIVFVVDFTLLRLFSWFLPRLTSISLAYVLAVCLHFTLNKFWVFGARRSVTVGEVVRYLLNVAATWLCTVLVAAVALRWVTDNVFLAKAIAVPPTTLLGFALLRLFVFHAPPESPPADADEPTDPFPGQLPVPEPARP